MLNVELGMRPIIQHSTLNIKKSTFNIQHSTLNYEFANITISGTVDNIQYHGTAFGFG